MIGKFVSFLGMPPSRRMQYLQFQWARLVTASWHRLRLAAVGSGTIVLKPLFWTPEFIKLGSKVVVWPGCRIEAVEYDGRLPLITVGDGVTFQQGCHVTCADQVTIGPGTSVLARATITDIDHSYEAFDMPLADQPVRIHATRIGAHCFIGSGALILAGTQLGDHCVVGANAVVRGSYPAGTVLAGAPARILRQYDPASRLWHRNPLQGSTT